MFVPCTSSSSSSSPSSCPSQISSLFYCFLASFLILNIHDLRISNSNGTCTAAEATITSRPPPPPPAHVVQMMMSYNHYARTCPQLEELVASVTNQQYKDSPVSGPATIRLFFHDCFVDGCDASILIATKQGSKEYVEKDALDNKDLREEGFETVAKAKALVETKCPGVVSCADILALAARDFVHLAGGPYYQVKKGRWDGKISAASRVANNLPRANSTIDQIIKLFNSKGLTLQDMVVLSGAHTIGFAHCKHFLNRLYDYNGSKNPDPWIDQRLLKELKMYCPQFGGNTDIVAPFDVTTPFAFDHAYYGNLEAKMGLLGSDQVLYTDLRTRSIVQELGKDKDKFFQAFSVAMEKMGSIGVKRGRKHGEQRRVCSVHI